MGLEDEKPPNPLWLKLSEVLNYNPAKFNRFKEMIDQAKIDMEFEFEQQRKKALEDFLMRKRTKNIDFQALIKQVSSH